MVVAGGRVRPTWQVNRCRAFASSAYDDDGEEQVRCRVSGHRGGVPHNTVSRTGTPRTLRVWGLGYFRSHVRRTDLISIRVVAGMSP